jgi:hypothetical protein
MTVVLTIAVRLQTTPSVPLSECIRYTGNIGPTEDAPKFSCHVTRRDDSAHAVLI